MSVVVLHRDADYVQNSRKVCSTVSRSFLPIVVSTIFLLLISSFAPITALAETDQQESPLSDIVNQLLGRDFRAIDENGDGIVDAADLRFVTRGETIYRINSGGPAFTDSRGNTWQADSAIGATGTVYTTQANIIGTSLQQLYGTERYQLGGPLRVNLPVEPGEYIVRLHFAEIFHSAPGSRILNVFAENTTLASNLDLVASVGPNAAMVLEGRVSVWDGSLSVVIKATVDASKLAGVEVLRVRRSDEARTAIARLNAGGPAFIDPFGRNWTGDAGFYNIGQTFSTTTGIFGSPMQDLYKTER